MFTHWEWKPSFEKCDSLCQWLHPTNELYLNLWKLNNYVKEKWNSSKTYNRNSIWNLYNIFIFFCQHFIKCQVFFNFNHYIVRWIYGKKKIEIIFATLWFLVQFLSSSNLCTTVFNRWKMLWWHWTHIGSLVDIHKNQSLLNSWKNFVQQSRIEAKFAI